MKKIVVISSALMLSAACALAAPQDNPQQADSALAVEVSRKMAKVLENQERILSKLEEIKAELQVVKVRATLQ